MAALPGLAAATRLSTGGSAIYRQLRVGQGGIPFTLFKFRTMRARKAGPEVTAPGDDRVTRLGALLRKTSIDELPQLVNVLRGDMTLVGPRPETVSLARRYPEELQFVFRYRPGITGPSQVLVRDEKVLGQVADVENFYLTELRPAPGRHGSRLPEVPDVDPHDRLVCRHVPVSRPHGAAELAALARVRRPRR